MRIFITQKQVPDKYQQINDSLESRYIEYFLEKNIFPTDAVFIPVINHLAHCQQLVEKCPPDFVIFTGSNDVQRPAFQNSILESTQRDRVESYLIHYCDQRQIPKLAICRGFQFLNVHYGGLLDYELSQHPINESKSHLCLYNDAQYHINSYHQHGVKLSDLANHFHPLVTSIPDKLIEAATHASNAISPTLAVQWHPERKAFAQDLFAILFNKVMYESGVISSRHG